MRFIRLLLMSLFFEWALSMNVQKLMASFLKNRGMLMNLANNRFETFFQQYSNAILRECYLGFCNALCTRFIFSPWKFASAFSFTSTTSYHLFETFWRDSETKKIDSMKWINRVYIYLHVNLSLNSHLNFDGRLSL